MLIALSLISIWHFSAEDRDSFDGAADYGLVFPDLIDRLNDVNEIRIATPVSEYSVVFRNGDWRVSEFDLYPARPGLARDFLLGLAQLRMTDKKTSDPDRFASIGLEGLDAAESRTIHIELFAESDSRLASLLAGEQRPSVRNPLLTEIHIRLPGENQTWLAESGLAIPRNAIDWLDTEIVDLDRRVREVAIESDQNQPVKVSRDDADSNNFSLAAVAGSHKIRHQYKLNDIGRIFRRLRFDGVRRATGWQSAVTVSAQTFDGLKVAAQFGRGEVNGFIRIKAQAAQGASESIIGESEMMNRRWAGWMYRISEARQQTAEFTLNDLTEPANGS